MKIENFDFDFSKEKLNQLLKWAEEKFPNKEWIIEIRLFQDGDYILEATNAINNGEIIHNFWYKKSDDKFHYSMATTIQHRILKGLKMETL